jgi:Protein of unknown function, DUF547
MRRRLLNEPVTTGTDEPGVVAERLQAAMLAALGAHTDAEGRVDYDALAGSAELAVAEQAARELGGVRLDTLDTRGARLAFWLNVYNALALHGIVRLGVRRSVLRIWNFFGRVNYRVGGLVFSLDDIEHGLLRGNRRRTLPPLRPFRRRDRRLALAVAPPDPRYHFAITCGAASCPTVGVSRAAHVDAQLDLAARGFVNQETVLREGRIVCSRLFKWYRDDFERAGGLRAFLLRHLDEGPARTALVAGALPCTDYLPYRWTLQHPARH